MAVCKVCHKRWKCREDISEPPRMWEKYQGVPEDQIPEEGDCTICTCPDCRAKDAEATVGTVPRSYIVEVSRRYVCPYCHRTQYRPFGDECPDCHRKLAGPSPEIINKDGVIWL